MQRVGLLRRRRPSDQSNRLLRRKRKGRELPGTVHYWSTSSARGGGDCRIANQSGRGSLDVDDEHNSRSAAIYTVYFPSGSRFAAPAALMRALGIRVRAQTTIEEKKVVQLKRRPRPPF